MLLQTILQRKLRRQLSLFSIAQTVARSYKETDLDLSTPFRNDQSYVNYYLEIKIALSNQTIKEISTLKRTLDFKSKNAVNTRYDVSLPKEKILLSAVYSKR